MILATFSVYIAILKEIGMNLAIFTPPPQKDVFPLLHLKLDHLKTRLYPPLEKIWSYTPPPVDSDLAHH